MFYGLTPDVDVFLQCECPSHANPLVSGAALGGPYVCYAGQDSRSRGDFFVQSCLHTRVGLRLLFDAGLMFSHEGYKNGYK